VKGALRGVFLDTIASMPDAKNLPVPGRTMSLTKWERVASVGAGIATVAVASVAELWARLDGIGTVAFVVAGTAAVLLGVIGRMPTRLSAKDYAMEFYEREKDRAVEAEVENVVEDLPTSAKKEIAKKAELDEQETVPVSTSRSTSWNIRRRIAKGRSASNAAIRSLDFEQFAIYRLTPILIMMGYIVNTTYGEEDYQDADYVATGLHGQIFIFVRRWTGDAVSILRERVKAKRFLALNPENRAIIVVDRPDLAEDYDFEWDNPRIATVSPSWSKDRLTKELTELLSPDTPKE